MLSPASTSPNSTRAALVTNCEDHQPTAILSIAVSVRRGDHLRRNCRDHVITISVLVRLVGLLRRPASFNQIPPVRRHLVETSFIQEY